MANDLKGRRAELMAELFLQDLGATVWQTGDREPFDFLATFRTPEDKLRLVAVEVKSAENVSGGEFRFHGSPKSVGAWRHSNVPVLVLVADVKKNAVFFGWGAEIKTRSDPSKGRSSVVCTLPLTPGEAGRDQLRDAILSQPDVSERAAVG